MTKNNDILVMEDTLRSIGINVEEGYSYKMYSLRKGGYKFTFEDHVEAMVLSLLSANRPWKQIEDNISNISRIFKQYDVDYIMSKNPVEFANEIRSIGCGNRAIVRQMSGLADNIKTLQRIDEVLGDVDKLTNVKPYKMSELLSDGYYKIHGFAQTLALQYLRNVGVDTCKPDVHIRRILYRLGYTGYEDVSIWKIMSVMEKLSTDLEMPITLINEIIWHYGATGYGEICSKIPKCEICKTEHCKYRYI
jgi:endonuclease III